MSKKVSQKSFIFLLVIRVIAGSEIENRIVSGYQVKAGEFPYQASIRYSDDDSHFCGGSIITPKHILTAAHCCFNDSDVLEPPVFFKVVVGQLKLNITNSTISRRVSRVVVHSRYLSRTMISDIAIMELEEELPFSEFVAAVPLYESFVAPRNSCVVSGWGFTSPALPVVSNHLLAAEVFLLGYPECQKRYHERHRRTSLSVGMLCAVNDERLSGPCEGDSGGPLVCVGRLIGIVSFGQNCSGEFPAIFTAVPYYMPWIRKHTTKTKQGTVADGDDETYREASSSCSSLWFQDYLYGFLLLFSNQLLNIKTYK